jgi:hypothetical protein
MSAIDKQIRDRQVIEFLRAEFRVKEFMERTLGRPLGSDVTTTVKNGVAIEFLNALQPDHSSKYDAKPKTIHHEIGNIRIFNDRVVADFGLRTFF